MNKNLPKIIYGTAWKKEATTELVVQALESGFRAIDTACQPKHYDEKRVGDALKIVESKGIKREDIFLQTKFTPVEGQDINTIPYNKNANLKQQVEESFLVSKQNLQTSYIDSFVLHSPLFPFTHLMQVWEVFESLNDTKEVLHLGISNCYDLKLLTKLYENVRIKPSYVQNRFYTDTDYDKNIRAWCKEHNVVYQSFWTLTANPHLLENKTLIQLAIKYKKSVPQILFNFLSHINIVPLSGTTALKHMQEDLLAFDFKLNEQEYESINSLL